MKRTPLKKQILSALVNEVQTNGRFLSAAMIAAEVFGSAYTRKTSWTLIQMVKNNMASVRELADANGMLIIPLRKPTKGNDDKKFIIDGWKIAKSGFDEPYITDELMYKYQNGKARHDSFKRLANTAKDKQLLGEEKYHQLMEVNLIQ
jgi:hypothetical protein